MSATRDKSQRHMFVYNNLHTIYKTGKGHEGVIAVLRNKEIKKADDPWQSLKQNLKELDLLHKQLKAMIDELEELVK